MGKNQGLIRLKEGFARKLHSSEKERGYLFVSMDKKILSEEYFEVYLNDKYLGKKKIDKYGRIILGKKNVSKIGDKKLKFIKDNKKLKLEY